MSPSAAGADRPAALAYRAIGLGDCLAGVPALRVLRAALPGHRLVLAAPGVLAPLVALADVVDEVLPTGELEAVRWPAEAWGPVDVGVDLHGNGPASADLVAALGPRRLVAFAAPGGPAWRTDEHEVLRWCRLVAEGLGRPDLLDPAAARSSRALRLRRPEASSPAPGCAVVHVGAASPSRRWPPERFGAVVAALVADGRRVALTGSAAEAPLAAEVRRSALERGADPSAVVDTSGSLDLVGLAALVADAAIVVSGDTGVAHLASAYAVPSVVLCGPVAPDRWGPPLDGPHVALWHGDGRGDPHGRQPDPALLAIGVDEVLDAARAALAPA